MQITIPMAVLPASLLVVILLAIPGDAQYYYSGGHGGSHGASYGGGYASVHSGDHHGGLYDTVQPGPAKVLTFPGTVPSPKCGSALFLKCHKSVQKVPCVPGGHLGGYAASVGAYGAAPAHHGYSGHGYASPSHGGSY